MAAKKPARSPSPPEQLPSAFTLFEPSMQAVGRNLLSFLTIVLLPSIYFEILDYDLTRRSGHPAIWLYIIGIVYGICIFAATPYLQLKTAQGQQVDFAAAIKDGFHYFWRLLGLYILLAIIIIGGLILLIVPGVIFIRRYYLAQYFLIDGDIGIIKAMRLSAAASKSRDMAVWGVIGVQILLQFSSLIPIIGTFVASLLNLAYTDAAALRYEQLKVLPPYPSSSRQT